MTHRSKRFWIAFNQIHVILHEQNLTKVADRLDTTQPAISKILARWRSHFEDPNLLLRLPSFMAGAVVAARTDALAILPANLAKFIAADLKLAIFSPPLSLPRIEIGQYWHERYHADPGHRWFRALNRRTFGART